MRDLDKLDLILRRAKEENIVKAIIELKNIAKKHNQHKIARWCELELCGYKNQKEDTPHYRNFDCNFLECHLSLDSHSPQIRDIDKARYIINEEKIQLASMLVDIAALIKKEHEYYFEFNQIIRGLSKITMDMNESLHDFFIHYNRSNGMTAYHDGLTLLAESCCSYNHKGKLIPYNKVFLFLNKSIMKKRIIENLKINIYDHVEKIKVKLQHERNNQIHLTEALNVISTIKKNSNEILSLKNQIIEIENELKLCVKSGIKDDFEKFNTNFLSPLANVTTIAGSFSLITKLIDIIKLLKFD
jgi:hypothetical protein